LVDEKELLVELLETWWAY